MYPRPLPCLGNNQLQQRPANNTLFPSRLCKEPSISSPWSSSSYWTSSSSSRSGGGVWHVQSTDGVRVWHCRGGQSLLFLLFSTTFIFFILLSYSAFPPFLNNSSFLHISVILGFSSFSQQLFFSSYFSHTLLSHQLFISSYFYHFWQKTVWNKDTRHFTWLKNKKITLPLFHSWTEDEKNLFSRN